MLIYAHNFQKGVKNLTLVASRERSNLSCVSLYIMNFPLSACIFQRKKMNLKCSDLK